MQFNQQKLTTHREMHNFWKFFVSGKEEGQALMTDMPDDRETCNYIGELCVCKNYK